MQLCLPEFVIDRLVDKGYKLDLSEWNTREDEYDVFLRFKNSFTGVTHKLTGRVNGNSFILKSVKVIK